MTVRHLAKKRFGQNFLQDQYIINEIIRLINPQADEFILEIGPGLAALTKPLLEQVKQLHVVEIDRDIIHYLSHQFGANLIIHAGDALKFDYSFAGRTLRVIGNLPYNISTPLLFHLAEFSNIQDMHFMLQKEVVERICASPNSSDYGRLSIMLQYKFYCTKLLEVSKKCFEPQPKVESAIVRLKPRPKAEWEQVKAKRLNQIVTAAFSQRRKTISNSLKNLLTKETLDLLNIDAKKRAENLSVAEYLSLAAIDQI
ncbi:MAG: 16S rRNA (adenine(1518)-N(6)/adenine(1519)-N(6))-dimethyltransferase RsmA [Burkholderiales bacterium]